MPFDADYCRFAVEHMQKAGVVFEAGLTDPEIDVVERNYGFTFPPDLRLFLQAALPVTLERYIKQWDETELDGRFPNWRKYPTPPPFTPDDVAQIRAYNLSFYVFHFVPEGIFFDASYQKPPVWRAHWGERPDDADQRLERIRQLVKQAPPLIPIYSHRYLPTRPLQDGNPIFSIMQTDIIYYGDDLADYLYYEFKVPRPEWTAKQPRYIEFWSDLCDGHV